MLLPWDVWEGPFSSPENSGVGLEESVGNRSSVAFIWHLSVSTKILARDPHSSGCYVNHRFPMLILSGAAQNAGKPIQPISGESLTPLLCQRDNALPEVSIPPTSTPATSHHSGSPGEAQGDGRWSLPFTKSGGSGGKGGGGLVAMGSVCSCFLQESVELWHTPLQSFMFPFLSVTPQSLS